jgi:hypothetical protein
MVVESSAVNKARRGEGSRRSLEAGEGGESEVRAPDAAGRGTGGWGCAAEWMTVRPVTPWPAFLVIVRVGVEHGAPLALLLAGWLLARIT